MKRAGIFWGRKSELTPNSAKCSCATSPAGCSGTLLWAGFGQPKRGPGGTNPPSPGSIPRQLVIIPGWHSAGTQGRKRGGNVDTLSLFFHFLWHIVHLKLHFSCCC